MIEHSPTAQRKLLQFTAVVAAGILGQGMQLLFYTYSARTRPDLPVASLATAMGILTLMHFVIDWGGQMDWPRRMCENSAARHNVRTLTWTRSGIACVCVVVCFLVAAFSDEPLLRSMMLFASVGIISWVGSFIGIYNARHLAGVGAVLTVVPQAVASTVGIVAIQVDASPESVGRICGVGFSLGAVVSVALQMHASRRWLIWDRSAPLSWSSICTGYHLVAAGLVGLLFVRLHVWVAYLFLTPRDATIVVLLRSLVNAAGIAVAAVRRIDYPMIIYLANQNRRFRIQNALRWQWKSVMVSLFAFVGIVASSPFVVQQASVSVILLFSALVPLSSLAESVSDTLTATGHHRHSRRIQEGGVLFGACILTTITIWASPLIIGFSSIGKVILQVCLGFSFERRQLD